MRAVYFEQHGEIDGLRFGDLAAPEAGPGMVLVRLRAAALNHLDLFVLSGLPSLRLEFPHVPGADGAGKVEAVGEGIRALKPGDPVLLDPGLSCGTCGACAAGEHSMCDTFHLLGEHAHGTFAELVAVPQENVHPIPAHLEIHEAAAFPLVYCTAWRMLVKRGRVKPGEWVLIHGIGGGVSTAALQIASRIGARCIVTSGSAAKLDRAAEVGAEQGVLYGKNDVTAEVLRITDKRGVDLVIDSVGQATWQASLQSLRKGGRLVTCGATTGPQGTTLIPLVFWKQLEILGSTMAGRGDFLDMLRFVEAARMRPVIDSRFGLREAPSAYRRMKAGHQFGKIVIDIP
jgi:NADPH:quinone reductase-like Zn-dependent oxidoreductase